jgi:hypothetical protein
MEKNEMFKSWATYITTLSIIVGIVISVLNFKVAKEKEVQSRKIEAAKPFLELRQKLYFEALNKASILASQELHTDEEIKNAKKRFYELYWGELSLVEESSIESDMILIAKSLESGKLEETKNATYKLAHSMRKSLIKSWGMDTVKLGNVNE